MADDQSAADQRFMDFLQQQAKRFDNRAQQVADEGIGGFSGTGARTGFGRRTTEAGYDTEWDEEVPYPQISPTDTTDPDRPRTTEAGYDPQSRILMVTFRDGTRWQYYNVDPIEWAQFQLDPSPGRYIREILDSHPYGRAPETFQT